MYESYYGLDEKPFSLLPDPAFLFMAKKHSMALSMLEYAVVNECPISVITGEIGSGKTTLIRYLLNRFDESVSVGLINNTHKSFGNLLQWVSLAYELPYQDKQEVTLYQQFVDFLIGEYAASRRTVLIVDEAQNMDADTLEELRVLSNVNADKHNVLQLVLVGQPELRRTLRRPELEQFVQRVGVAYHLGRLAAEETSQYIGHRIETAGGDPEIFTPVAKRFIHHRSRGIPRIINSLCDMALVYGFAEQIPIIDIELVHEMINDKMKGGFFSHVEAEGDEADRAGIEQGSLFEE